MSPEADLSCVPTDRRLAKVSISPATPSWRDALVHPLFSDVHEDKIAAILRELPVRRVSAGKLLSWPYAAPPQMHLVLSGRLHAYLLNSLGQKLLLEIIEAGGADGLIAVTGHPGHFTDVVSDSVVISISAPQLQRLVAAEPKIGVSLVGLIVVRLQAREERMESMASRGPTGLARLLLSLVKAHGSTAGSRVKLDLRLTHQMLADMLGIRRETVTLQWPHLVSSGAVEIIKGNLFLDPAALRRLAEPKADSGAHESQP